MIQAEKNAIDRPGVPAGPACPLCGEPARFKFAKQGQRFYECRCRFVFLWPRPAEEELEKIYHRDGEEYWTTEPMVEFAFAPTKSRREMVRRFVASGSLLDVGCSTGGFVKAAGEAGFQAEGVDICRPAVEWGRRRGLPLRAADILRDGFDRTYQVVTLWATLEHVPHPQAHLHAVRDLLAPGGTLFVSVPNYASLTQALLGKWDRYVVDEHLNYFTPRVLRRTLEGAGFRVVGQRTCGFNPLFLLKDLVNRGKKAINCQEAARDASRVLTLKRLGLVHLGTAVETMLDCFSAADVVSMAAVKG